MKKLIALTLALVLALAACAVPAEETPASGEPAPSVAATQHPEPTLPFEFGTLRLKYSPYSRVSDRVECFGDKSLLLAQYILCGPNAEPESIMFRFTAHEPVALTSAHYDDGELVDEPMDCELGVIERIVDGEWAHYCTLERTSSETDAALPYRVVEDKFNESFAFRAYDEDEERIVSYEPGSYRITLYFRLSIDDGERSFTTSDELYSIQILFQIPDTIETQFDLVNVGFVDSYAENQTFGVLPFIRRNEPGATIYIDHARTRLEVRSAGEWVEAEPREGQASAVENLAAEDSPNRHADERSGFMTTVYVSNRAASYRVVYEYCENADGSGERGTLTLPLDFAEPVASDDMTTLSIAIARSRAQGSASSAHTELFKAGLDEHPSFGGDYLTEDNYLGVNVKGGDPEFKEAVLAAVDSPDIIRFYECAASTSDLEAELSAFFEIFSEQKEAYGLGTTGSFVSSTSSLAAVILFARSKAGFDEFIEQYGDQISDNIYFELTYGIDLAEVAAHPDDAPPPPPEVADDWGITLVASNVTRTSATVTFHRAPGILDGTDRNPITGAGWNIDVWDGDEWVDIPLPDYIGFAIGYPLGEFDINWERVCGVLPPGYYRICKEASTAAPNYENRSYYAQFTITDSTPENLSGE